MDNDRELPYTVLKFLNELEFEGDELNQSQIIDSFIEAKNQNANKLITTDYLRKSEKSSQFKSIYNQLKAENVIELDSVVYLIDKLLANNDLKNFAYLHAGRKNATRTISNMSRKDSHESLPRSSSLNLSANNSKTKVLKSESANNSFNLLSLSNMFKPDKLKNEFISLSYDFKPIDWTKEDDVVPLNNFNLLDQESLLISDLLNVLVGIEGKYVRLQLNTEKKKNYLVITSECDEILKTNVNRIIAFCPLYSIITHFSENYDNCLVNQAFIGFLRSNMKEYLGLITQLEILHHKKDLTLQKMWYFLNSFKENMEILKSICQKIKQGNCIGGATLSIMHEKTNLNAGNMKIFDFCLTMTKFSSQPYFKILERWITEGEISDPYNEFFIETKEVTMQESNYDNDFWDNRYTIVKNRLPIFLVKLAEKILKTGKYINVIRQIRKDIELPYCEELSYSSQDHVFNERIELAYNFSSKQLLSLLFEDCNLIEHINSIKLYFFIEKGDFIVEFMNSADDELDKEIHEIIPTRLESLLEHAIRTSVVNSDPHADYLGIGLINESILDQFSHVMSYGNDNYNEDEESSDDFRAELKGFETICLKYKVEWPLTLVFNKKNMACYQMLFRYLFYCKYVERKLQKVWIQIKNFKNSSMKSSKITRICGILQKMFEFVYNLEYFMVVEVIEPNFHILLEKIKNKVNSIDDMIEEHDKFVKTVFNNCMLNEKYAFKSMSKLFKFCINFAKMIEKSNLSFEIEDSTQNEKLKKINLLNEATLNRNLDCLHTDFIENLLHLLEEIMKQQSDNYSASIIQILCRLDYNNFYASLVGADIQNQI